jgi:16S rRNA processing protein RimM
VKPESNSPPPLQAPVPEETLPHASETPAPLEPWLLLAHILRPQGRKGEVLADLFTDFPDRFNTNPRVYLAPPGFTGPEDQARTAQVLSFFLPTGRNQGRIVLHLAGFDCITQAETLAYLDILVPHQERVEPEEDASFISDLVGCTVYDHDVPVGTVADVHIPTTPDGTRPLEDAAPLLVVLSPTGAEILIPFVKAYLAALEPEEKRILMRLPPGLLEINS